MSFFNNFTILKAIGLAILAAGAIVTYKSEKLALAVNKPHRELLFKICGLSAVIIAFIIIMTEV